MLQKLQLTIRRGASEDIPIRIESDRLVYVAITGIANSAPIRITAPAHGCPDGWRALVEAAVGMDEINTPWDGVTDDAFRRTTLVDTNTVEFNDVNAATFGTWTSGGQLVYREPLDLAQFVEARMDVKGSVSGPVLATYRHTAGSLLIDTAANALRLKPSIAETLLLTASRKVFDIELVRADGSVVAVCSAKSTLTVLPEITTST